MIPSLLPFFFAVSFVFIFSVCFCAIFTTSSAYPSSIFLR
jgi:hypothetical protein